MNIGNLKDIVAAYFAVSASSFVIGGTDLLLVALNAARKKAELVHDFEYSKVFVDLEVDNVAGGELASAVLSGTADAVGIKSIISGGSVDEEGNFRAMRFSTTTSIDKERLNRSYQQYFHDDCRYPSDAQSLAYGVRGRSRILQFGSKIFYYPFGTSGETTNLRLQVYKWYPDYADNADTDLFTAHGHDYLKWAAIVEVNYHEKAFVPRQEGQLGPPTSMADSALASLIAWDEYLIEGARS